MTCYIISFEVDDASRAGKIKQALKNYKAFCPINKRCWAVATDSKAKDIRDRLSPILTPQDRLFVIRSGTEAAWRNAYGPKNSEWLKKYL